MSERTIGLDEAADGLLGAANLASVESVRRFFSFFFEAFRGA
jgi:hypothetical protein